MGVNLPIATCGDCPHKTEDRFATADSWEWGKIFLWSCKKTERPKPPLTSAADRPEVTSFIGFEEDGETPTQIPQWCPLRKQE